MRHGLRVEIAGMGLCYGLRRFSLKESEIIAEWNEQAKQLQRGSSYADLFLPYVTSHL